MTWATGVEAQDWEAVAKKEKLNVIQVRPLCVCPSCLRGFAAGMRGAAARGRQLRGHGKAARAPAPMRTRASITHPRAPPAARGPQTEMRRLEQVVQTIYLDLQIIRRKEEKMRDVNGAPRPRRARCVRSPAPPSCLPQHCTTLPATTLHTLPATTLHHAAEATNTRVAWFNILAALLVCTFCGWQLWYLNKVRWFCWGGTAGGGGATGSNGVAQRAAERTPTHAARPPSPAVLQAEEGAVSAAAAGLRLDARRVLPSAVAPRQHAPP